LPLAAITSILVGCVTPKRNEKRNDFTVVLRRGASPGHQSVGY
jgi:hypothetical protein